MARKFVRPWNSSKGKKLLSADLFYISAGILYDFVNCIRNRSVLINFCLPLEIFKSTYEISTSPLQLLPNPEGAISLLLCIFLLIKLPNQWNSGPVHACDYVSLKHGQALLKYILLGIKEGKGRALGFLSANSNPVGIFKEHLID